MKKKYIGKALFDDKDIMFDAFMEDISPSDVGFCRNGDYDALTYICGIPVRFRTSPNAKICWVTYCLEDDRQELFQELKNQLNDWNKNQSDSVFKYNWKIFPSSAFGANFEISADIYEITE